MAEILRPKILKACDKAIVECFSHLCEKFKVNTIIIVPVGGIQQITVPIPIDLNNEIFNTDNKIAIVEQQRQRRILKEIMSFNSILILRCIVTICDISITYERNIKDVHYDEFIISKPDNPKGDVRLSDSEIIEIISIIYKELHIVDNFYLQKKENDEFSNKSNHHLSIINRLEALSADIISKNHEYHKIIDSKFEERVSEHNNKLEELKNALSNDYNAKLEKIESKEKALAEERKQLDDRNNTHVRREIRDKMLSDVTNRIEKFGVSASTSKKRGPVRGALAIITIILFAFFILTSIEAHKVISTIPTGQSLSVYFFGWFRVIFSFFVFISSIIYYAKWENNWASLHASSEFQLQQFHLDINRANWVIESCLEWKKESQETIPTELLDSITKNLFLFEKNDLHQVSHPADDLASALLGSASKLKLNLGGNELEFDKPGKIGNKCIAASKIIES